MKMSVFYQHLTEAARQQGLPAEQVLLEARALGYEGLEVDHRDLAADPEGFAAFVGKAGFTVCSIPYFAEFHKGIYPEKIAAAVRDVAAVGCRRILAIPGEWTGAESELTPLVEGLTLLCREAARCSITVTLEDFDSVKSPCATAEGLAFFFDRVPNLRFNLDTGNFLYTDQDVLSCVPPLMDRIAHIHLKDRSLTPLYPGEGPLLSVSGNPLYPAPVGSGVIPMARLIALARDAGYDGYCSAEHFGAADQWDYLVRSAKWLRDNLPTK